MSTDRTDAGLTTTIVDWALGLRLEDIPAEAIEVTRHCLLDWLAVTVAGANEEVVALLAAEVTEDGGRRATLIGRRERAGVVDAAYVNGTASHVLDFDDVHMGMLGHPSAPVFPALLALAEETPLDGATFLRAAVCGLESEMRLGSMIFPEHYDRGWHTTATVGAVGAAVACSIALGADARQLRNAIGIAVSEAAGLKSMFGTMTKSLQVGRAAANGALAARLALRGADSCATSLEDAQGMLPIYAGSPGDPAAWQRDRFEIPDNLFKYHAACYLTHAGIDAARSLIDDGLDASTITNVRLGANPANLAVCGIPDPSTGLEAKFSMTATSAMALLGVDTGDPTVYDTVAVSAPEVRDLMGRTAVATDPAIGRSVMTVTIELTDGTTLVASGDSSLPERDLGLQRERLEAKFMRLVAPLLGDHAAALTVQSVRDVMASSDVGAIARLLVRSDAN